ncbi:MULTISPECIES: ABC transporter permease [Roseiflexus]|uniref:Binding-protein-dependent transport systems inner membrane component n=1 Tax=Roseiflexus castenholzii (strain DSM 13941 / HLO8) TaxID=383372 RepID=A7NQN1_ROSCS|nr:MULTISPECIES: ABC transporter permease [Roseiflexus]ABU59877.1 binding-protein-dependent transport systems inner membrane component [Roseiflexus castenholzii DSM 13941]GIW03346.1 MAG: glutathione ABC transporter permease GsiD [Roseiflexus sp.]
MTSPSAITDASAGSLPFMRRRAPPLIAALRRNTPGLVGLIIITLVVLAALLAPVISPYSPTAQVSRRLLEPGAQYLLGTDEFGRDIFSRVIYGSRISLYVGAVSVSLALVFGGALGLIAGYAGGRIDTLLMRLIDMLFAIPSLVLAIVIAGLLGPSLTNAMIAIGIVYAPIYARLVRGEMLAVRNYAYIEAAHAVGVRHIGLITRYFLPNIAAPLIVQTSLLLSTAILAEAALSFLGLGAQPPDPSWGAMLGSGRRFMELTPWVAIAPGIAIVITVLGFNLLGDGLRDVLDPRLRGST